MEMFELEPNSEARKTLTLAYDRIVKTMFDNLEIFAREIDVANPDDKEQLNAHILTMGKDREFCLKLISIG